MTPGGKFGWSLVVVLATVGTLGLFARGAGGAETKAKFETRTSRKGSLRVLVREVGQIEPEVRVQIKSPVSGRIEKMHVDVGSTVEVGQVLCEIDRRELESGMRIAKAGLIAAAARRSSAILGLEIRRTEVASSEESARAGLDSARRDEEVQALELERVTSRVSKGLAAKRDPELESAKFEAARARRIKAETDLRRALQGRASLDQASLEVEIAMHDHDRAAEEVRKIEEQLSDTTIRSPIRGCVITKSAEVGEVATSARISQTAGTPIFEVADLSRLIIKVQVNELDIARIEAGASAEVTLDAFPGESFQGRVRMAGLSANVNQQTGTRRYDCLVDLLSRSPRIRTGMTANVAIVVAEHRDAVVLPRIAVFRNKAGEEVAYEMVGGKPTSRKLTLGDHSETEVVVRTGLESSREVTITDPIAEARLSDKFFEMNE